MESECIKNTRVNKRGKVMKTRYICQLRHKKFGPNSERHKHLKSVHHVNPRKGNISCLESGCNFVCGVTAKLQFHLVEVHNKIMETEDMTFNCFKDFEIWKEAFEKQQKSNFVKQTGSRAGSKNQKRTYLYCSRSGKFVSRNTGLKQMKRTGSCKINNRCTASITYTQEASGKIKVKVCSTHYGHNTNEVKYLRLTRSEKANIASLIGSGVPREIVVDKIRSSVGESFDRLHLLTMKDINNIEHRYGIKSVTLETNVSEIGIIDDWIKELNNLEHHSPVQFYKQKNHPHNVLTSDDFCLVLMATSQCDLFKKFGPNGIFYMVEMPIDNGCNLHLFTLMIADDLNEMLPAAFMICNRKDLISVRLFYQIIHDKIGSIQASGFMTDDDDVLFQGWCLVMGDVKANLLSNRYVDSDWREKLAMIKDEELQCSIYESLYRCFETTNISTFITTFTELIDRLVETDETSSFGYYLRCHYANRAQRWACCYGKKRAGINAHLNQESLYNEIKAICMNKPKRRLDRKIRALLNLVVTTLYSRCSMLSKRTEEVDIHHTMALKIPSEHIVALQGGKFRVSSMKNLDKIFFLVQSRHVNCSGGQCVVQCLKCGICFHKFQCTCRVSSLDNTMCKHIHAVGISLLST